MQERRIDLDRARREAKRRVKDARARGEALKLADAQLAVARELGEASWPRLVRRVEAEAVAREDRARQLVLEATNGRRDHAEALLALDPELGREGFDAALVLGDAERVGPVLARDPGAATRPVGAREWLPLLYPTHSAFLGGERTEGLLECARALLAAGADPDSSWRHPEFGDLGALYGAAGVAHEPRMTALLLDAGANPDDDESVYHATETGDDACLRLLLDAGARVEGTNALAHALDTERPAFVRLLLEHEPGGDVRPSLLWAIYRERSPEVIRMLVEHGADLEAWDERNERTPYGLAWRMGRPDLCELLAGLGAQRRVGPIDELIGLCFAGERDGARRLAREHPDRVERLRTDFAEVLHEAAAEGRPEAVEILLDLGVPIDRPGQMGGAPLHHAAWWGHGDVVRELLDRGADPHRRAEPGTGGTPLAWTAHGSFHSPGPVARGGTDYLRIAELLLAAGARIEPEMLHEAHTELAELLRARAEEEAPEAAPGSGPEAGAGPEPGSGPEPGAGPEAEAGPGPTSEPDYGELEFAAHAAYLAHLATSPRAERRSVGDGFAVRTGLPSNSENGVVASAFEGNLEELVGWFAHAPAQWLLSDPTDLRDRLVAAGSEPERTAVVMGAPPAGLELGAPAGEPATDPDEFLAVAEAVGFTEARERHAALLRTLGPPLRLHLHRRDGAAVAIASTFTHADTALVVELAVLPGHRRRGIGRALLAHALAQAGPVAHVVLGPTPESSGFYRRLGFTLRPALRDRCFYLPVEVSAGG